MMRHDHDSNRTAYQLELLNQIEALMLKYVDGHERPVNRVINVIVYENGKRKVQMYSGV